MEENIPYLLKKVNAFFRENFNSNAKILKNTFQCIGGTGGQTSKCEATYEFETSDGKKYRVVIEFDCGNKNLSPLFDHIITMGQI